MNLADWAGFFTAQCDASAALIGLLFVALSINLQRIVESPYLVERVAESVLVFAGLLVFSVFGLVPGQGVAACGYETLATGVVVWSLSTWLQVRGFREHPPQATLTVNVSRTIEMQVATLSTIIAGVEMSCGNVYGVYWLVPATVASYVAGITNAWVLTVEILR